MPKETLYITGDEGFTYVRHPKLAYCEVMLVLRDGKMLVETTGTPSGKQFKHDSPASAIRLDTTLPIQMGGYIPRTDVLMPEQFIIEIRY